MQNHPDNGAALMRRRSESTAVPYLDYLKIEMTIMGLLSTFCIAVLALVADKLPESPNPNGAIEQIWLAAGDYILFGCAAMLAGAFLFYRQRSLLAWYYGELSTLLSKEAVSAAELNDTLDDAGSWATWIAYRQAFIAVFLACYEFGIAIATFRLRPVTPWDFIWTVYLPLGTAIIVGVFYQYMLSRYRYDEEPWVSLVRRKPAWDERDNAS